jgi:hypothetical protein
MISGALVLAAYAVGWCLIALIQERAEKHERPASRGCQTTGRAIMMTSAETTLGVRLPDKRLPLDPPRTMWHTGCQPVEREPRSQAATGAGIPYAARPAKASGHNVPAPRDVDRWTTSRIGVGRRAGVGTHRVSRVPVRMAQPARRRGGMHRKHPTPYGPLRDRCGGRGDALESCRHIPPMRTSNAVRGVSDSRTADRRYTSPPLPAADRYTTMPGAGAGRSCPQHSHR